MKASLASGKRLQATKSMQSTQHPTNAWLRRRLKTEARSRPNRKSQYAMGINIHGWCDWCKRAPRKHGPAFQLSAILRPADASEEFVLGKQKVRLRSWHKLHFKRFANVEGMIVCVEFLKDDGTPRYKRPLWLFWTGPESIAL